MENENYDDENMEIELMEDNPMVSVINQLFINC